MIEIILIKLLVNWDKLLPIPILISLGLALRVTLQIFGQTWIRTKAHTATILLLPIITYVITSVISGNIALSLGMVGALSIVRFRNPVRSPLELSVYFGVITMGIAASVSILWLIVLVAAIFSAIISLVIINMVSAKITATPFFQASFSEGNSISSMSIVAKKDIKELNEHKMLQSKIVSSKDGNVSYYLTSLDFDSLRRLEKNIQLNRDVDSVELRR